LVSPAREAILGLGVGALLERLRAGELQPGEVLRAYQAKALVVNEDINAVCDFLPEAAEQAAGLERLPPGERGPLYGLPVSVKECFLLAGHDSTIGLVGLMGRPAREDAPIIKMLRAQGAVPFCRTNVPQTMVSYGCSNPVYGETKNPTCPGRTPGGSSGGEGALLAAGGSPLGIGSDVGGSLRIPAAFTGVCGLKPTNGRIFEGGRRGGVGVGGPVVRNGVYVVSGFMSRRVEGIWAGMASLLGAVEGMSAEDWRVAPVPWREALARPGRKLKVGYYSDDGIFPATPGMVRAVGETVELLRAAGHQVEAWRPPGLDTLHRLWGEFVLADRGHFLQLKKCGPSMKTSLVH
jgi:fatty acid amide hydrolase